MTVVADDPATSRGVFDPDVPPMISYAQNGEDIVLRRVFRDVDAGFYVDVGAADPRRDSVTHHFVEQGWTGIDVEPQPGHAADLRRARPGNVVVEAVVGAEPGRAVLHVVPEAPGRSSMAADAVAAYRDMGIELVPLDVEVVTLATLCDRYRPSGPIHFLKIDAEGAEAEVLAGGDWERFRPMVVVMEVENAGSAQDPLVAAMVERRYRPLLFDGLNRFFLAEEHAELADRLQAPANIADAATWYVHADQVRHLEHLVRTLTARVAELEAARDADTDDAAPAAAAERAPRGRLDAVAARLAPHRSWLAPPGSRRETTARAVLVRLRRPS